MVSLCRVYYRRRALWTFQQFIRPTNKYGEVSFPTQVRYDIFYCCLAAYFYFDSALISARGVPLNKNRLKSETCIF